MDPRNPQDTPHTLDLPPATPRERQCLWFEPRLGDTLFLSASFVTHTYRRHTHPGYALGVIEAGVERFRYRGACHHAPPGALVCVHPQETHDGQAGIPEGFRYRMLYPSPEALEELLRDHPGGSLPPVPHPVIRDPGLARELGALHRDLEGTRGDRSRDLELRSRLIRCLGAFFVRHGIAGSSAGPLRDHPGVLLARERLHDAPGQEHRLQDLAALAGLSEYHFLRLFRRRFGLPPHQYLLQLRVEDATRRILEGTPPGLAALEAGFADQSHFTRVFRSIRGVPPGAFLRAFRGESKIVQDPPEEAGYHPLP